VAELAGVESCPASYHEQLSQQAQAPLCTQGWRRAIHEFDRLGDIARRVGRESQELGPSRIPVVDPRSLANPRTNASRRVDGRCKGKDFKSARIQIVVGDLLAGLGHESLCLSAGVRPPAAQGGPQQKIEREVAVAPSRCIAGYSHKPSDSVGIAWRTVVEDLAQPGHSCDVMRGEPQGGGGVEKPADSRSVAQLECQL